MALEDVLADEWIGRKVKIVEAKDPSLVGLEGKVVDESRNMFVIEVQGKEKRIPKAICKFLIEYEGKKLLVDGRMLIARPEDRVKRGVRLASKWHVPKRWLEH